MVAPSLDQIVTQITEVKPGKALEKDVVPALKKLEKSTSSKSTSVLEGKLADGSDPLAVLDPALHSAGYLFVLNARLGAADIDLATLIPFIMTFSETSDPTQLRLVPDLVNFFARQLAHVAREANEGNIAVLPLLNLIRRCASDGHLTVLHPLVLQVVMYTRSYEMVQELLLTDIVDIDSSLAPLKFQDNLLYHYLGGVIMSLTGQYTRAMDMLEIVVSSPGHSVAAIQVDAYKKLMLVQLLAVGKSQPLPKYTSAGVLSTCKGLCGAYIDYAAAYSAQDKARLVGVIEQHRDTYERDLNVGLLQLCAKAFRRRTIQKLTETYMTLSLPDIAKKVDLPVNEAGLKEVQDEILSMMTDGEVHGSITQSGDSGSLATVTVTFIDDPEPYNTHATVERVTRAINKAALLDQSLIARDLQLERSKDFVQKAWNAAGTLSGASGGGMSMGLGGMDDFEFGGLVGSGGAAGHDWDDGEMD